MKNLVLLCGGRSAEHEISIISARYIASLIDTRIYKIFIIGIDRDSLLREIPHEDLLHIKVCDSGHFATITRTPNGPSLQLSSGEIYVIDIVFPVLHGPGGEDGTIQGWLECLGVPYVGSGVLASAAAMDKEICKRILSSHKLPVVPFVSFHANTEIPAYEKVVKDLKSETLFIKPVALGSSIGISKVKGPEDYFEKIAKAFCYSTKIIIEKAIDGAEVECAVLGNDLPRASGVGEIIIKSGDFYDYDAKYLSAHKAEILTAARLSPEKIQEVRNLAINAFLALECSGMARIDLFVTEDEIFINEINTIPGFTPISLYPQLWKKAGILPNDLINQLIQCAYEKSDQRSNLCVIPFPNHLP